MSVFEAKLSSSLCGFVNLLIIHRNSSRCCLIYIHSPIHALFKLLSICKRVPLPVERRNNNLLAYGKIPDVEFQKNGETWVLDVRFTKPHNEEESFASNTD